MRRSRELGKPLTALAKEAGISRTYLYGLTGGASQDPSVRTLIKLAKALQVSPLLLFRYFADWTCPYKTGHQLPVKLMLPPSA